MSSVALPSSMCRFRSATWFVVAVICVAAFTDTFLYGTIIPVIPFALGDRLGVPEDQTQFWTSMLLTLYGGALLVGSVISGFIAGRVASYHSLFLLGLFALGGATVLLYLCTSLATLVAGRLLQGLAASVVGTVGLALLATKVPKENIGNAMGYLSLAYGLGIILSPPLGGLVYARAGYHAVFAMCFALIGIDIVLRLLMIDAPPPVTAQSDAQNVPGYGTLINSAPNPLTPGNRGQSSSGASSRSSGSSISDGMHQASSTSDSDDEEPHEASALLSSLKATSDQIVPLSKIPSIIVLLRSPRLLVILWSLFNHGCYLTAFDSVIPIFVSRVFHWESTGAGLTLIMILLPEFLSPVFGQLADKYGPRGLATGGFLLMAPSIAFLSFVQHDTPEQAALLFILLFALGFAFTMISTPLTAEIAHVAKSIEEAHPNAFKEKGATAEAYGLYNCTFAASAFAGPAIGGTLSELVGWTAMVWIFGAVALVTAAGLAIVFSQTANNSVAEEIQILHNEAEEA